MGKSTMAKVKEAIDGLPAWLVLGKASLQDRRSTKKGFYLTADAAKKLEIARVVEQLDQSVIIDALIRTELSGYKAYVNRGKGPSDEESGEVE